MPKKTLRELTERAIASGLNSSTPAVVITNVSRPDETTMVDEIGDIVDKVESARLPGPALVMIGQVLAGLIPARNHAGEFFETRKAT